MHKVKIISIETVTHDVKKFTIEKPEGYVFTPGQATKVSINKEKWKNEKRPFTFTSLSKEANLEFVIKKYTSHDGVTKAIHELIVGDELLIGDSWGLISYKGPGVFIAGGAGITPFIAIFKELEKKDKLAGNKLIFSNKKREDIILENDLKKWFSGKNLVLTLTGEKVKNYEKGRVNEDFLKKHINDFSGNFYICGPKQMVSDLRETLQGLGANVESIIFEK